MLNSKEHYELIAQFEKDFKKFPVANGRFDKEEKTLWAKRAVYQDGKVNELFMVYRSGYAFGKFVQL